MRKRREAERLKGHRKQRKSTREWDKQWKRNEKKIKEVYKTTIKGKQKKRGAEVIGGKEWNEKEEAR